VNKKVAKTIFAIFLIIAFTLFSKYYTDTFRVTREKYQDLYFAIGLSFAGISFHFLKNHPIVTKRTKMTMESLELLMLIMTPTVVSYKILKEIFPNNIYAIIIPTMIALGSWYTVTVIRTSRIGDEIDGKDAYSLPCFSSGA
jgi:hypothetical protein